ncbi:MAG TPA: copper homeostasis protein CutC [Bryobacteraceae bacterium]|jgi:copper homeostasis protein|nr:copper homeostasis protein CutC [Bryobacteraceae bacterium]
MRKVLEVIVTSPAEAIEAEAGGADRLELVRDLAHGGLTPDFEVVSAVLDAVRIPVRVMLRESATMSVRNGQELQRLQSAASHFAQLPLDGIVLGFIRDGAIDQSALESVLRCAPECRFTFHRAFEELPNAELALAELKRFPRIDRILTSGGHGDWSRRKARLLALQGAASPEISLMVGAGLSGDVLRDLARTPELREIHVGRAARAQHSVAGTVERGLVERLRNILQ